MKASDIITNALTEIGVQALGESVDSDTSAFALNKLNRLLDNWNAEGNYLYATTVFQGTLTAEHNPHTIGLVANSPDFTVTIARPQSLQKDNANLVLTDVTPNIFRPLNVVDDAWWMNNPVPTLETQIPYYCYYNSSWPNGQIYLWPVPTKAYDIRLLFDTLLSSLALSDTFTMPPGYEDAVTLSLAESLLQNFPSPEGNASAQLVIGAAEKARERIRNANIETPTMSVDGSVQSMDNMPKSSIANFDSGFFN